MTQLKAYKYRLYPTKQQAEYLDQVFGSVRFVWNQMVANFNSYSSFGPNQPMDEKILKDNPEYAWLQDSISYALQQKRIDFIEFKKQFFNKKRKSKLGRPKFKKRGVSNDSFRIPGQALGFDKCIDFENQTIKIPKMGAVKLVIDRSFNGQLKSITVSKNKCNQYFVSVLVEETIELKPNTGRSIGIDLGLNHLMSFSNGVKINNPRVFRESQAKLKKAQRHLSRKTKGSNRYNKQKLKVAKIHLDISNQRKFVLHNLTTWLVNNYDNIFVENLNVEGMKRSNLGKSVSDVSFSTIVSMLEYKCNWYGKTFNKVDRWFPSSKLCSECGYKHKDLQRGDSSWTCPDCGTIHDRDINAAVNILNQGLLDVYGLKSEELPDLVSVGNLNRRGEELRPIKCSHLKGIFGETSSNFYNFRNA